MNFKGAAPTEAPGSLNIKSTLFLAKWRIQNQGSFLLVDEGVGVADRQRFRNAWPHLLSQIPGPMNYLRVDKLLITPTWGLLVVNPFFRIRETAHTAGVLWAQGEKQKRIKGVWRIPFE